MRSNKRRGKRAGENVDRLEMQRPIADVQPGRRIFIARVGELECASDEGDDGPDVTKKRNTLIFQGKTFVVRDELDAMELKSGTLKHPPNVYCAIYFDFKRYFISDVGIVGQFDFSIVVENGKEMLHLVYRPDYPRWSHIESYIDRLVRTFFISSKENGLDFANDESDDLNLDELQQIADGDALDGGDVSSIEMNSGDIVSELYRQLRQRHFERDELITADASVQHPAMSATLKSYQVAAVRWMLHREFCETEGSVFEQLFRRWPSNDDDLADEETFFYNPYEFKLCTGVKPTFELPSGGILADEMGLGKTVEALALILLNKRPASDLMDVKQGNAECHEIIDDDASDDDDMWYEPPEKRRPNRERASVKCLCFSSESTASHKLIQCTKCSLRQHRKCVLKNTVGDVDEANYVCPQCWAHEDTVKTSATIIVSPRSIKMQWFQEVQKHINTDNFKVRAPSSMR